MNEMNESTMHLCDDVHVRYWPPLNMPDMPQDSHYEWTYVFQDRAGMANPSSPGHYQCVCRHVSHRGHYQIKALDLASSHLYLHLVEHLDSLANKSSSYHQLVRSRPGRKLGSIRIIREDWNCCFLNLFLMLQAYFFNQHHLVVRITDIKIDNMYHARDSFEYYKDCLLELSAVESAQIMPNEVAFTSTFMLRIEEFLMRLLCDLAMQPKHLSAPDYMIVHGQYPLNSQQLDLIQHGLFIVTSLDEPDSLINSLVALTRNGLSNEVECVCTVYDEYKSHKACLYSNLFSFHYVHPKIVHSQFCLTADLYWQPPGMAAIFFEALDPHLNLDVIRVVLSYVLPPRLYRQVLSDM